VHNGPGAGCLGRRQPAARCAPDRKINGHSLTRVEPLGALGEKCRGLVPPAPPSLKFPEGRGWHLTRAHLDLVIVPDILRPIALPADRGERRYVDADGVSWCVREKTTLGRGPALYFMSVGTFRRVTQYPDDWQALAAGELEALSRQT
jgi:hypothetical protein